MFDRARHEGFRGFQKGIQAGVVTKVDSFAFE
jgi:hypothetical protein